MTDITALQYSCNIVNELIDLSSQMSYFDTNIIDKLSIDINISLANENIPNYYPFDYFIDLKEA